MKKLISVLFVLLMLVGCGSSKGNNGSVSIFMPGSYIDEEILSSFEKETGIKVIYETFASNEEMYTKVSSGTVDYDILIPSDYMIQTLMKEDLIQKLDKDQVKVLDDIYEGVIHEYDPNYDYSVPYFWGNVGIVYDETVINSKDVESQGWSVMKNPKYAGQIYMYDSSRDSLMMAEKALGYSMNTESEEELAEVEAWLNDLYEIMDAPTVTDEVIDAMAFPEGSDIKYMALMYSGDAAYVLSENENMRFFAPKEGTNYWTDAMVISKSSKNVENAYKLINYLLEYDNAYANSSYVGYASPVTDVLNDLAVDEFEGNGAYIPRPMNSNDEYFINYSDKLRSLTSDIWTRVMAQ